MTPQPKPPKRGPRPPRRLSRTTPVRQRSSKRASVERQYSEWAHAVKRRARGGCERCGYMPLLPELHAHHIRTRKAEPRLRFDLLNGVALCPLDHAWAHAHPVLFKAWLLSVRPQAAVLWAAEEE